MDPLIAVGLASNVLSFIDFAGKLVGLGREIAESSHGTTVGNHELETTTATLARFCTQLTVKPADKEKRSAHRTKTELDIQDVADSSLKIAEELIKRLDNIRMKARNSSNTFVSIYYALKTVFHENEIESLRDRLTHYQNMLQIALILSIREETSQKIPSLVESLRSGSTLDQMRADILDEVHKLGGAQRADHAELQISLAGHLSSMSRYETDAVLTARLIEWLTFDDQDDRAWRIPEAHAATFKWVLAPKPREPTDQAQKWDDLCAWLRSDEHLYWITGKAGSGKSTLMKYITAQDKCTEHLRHWAGEDRLVVTNFYFWNSGSKHQMSQEGLLRSTLYQALSQVPELAPSVFKKRWVRSGMFGHDPRPLKMPELSEAFQNLLSQAEKQPFKLCMFVDGLDEFDGDLGALVQLFQQAVAQQNIKACLSSRPWNVFEVAFDTNPSLMLQDVTYPDILHFTTDRFKLDHGFQALARREPKFASTLINDIAEKACGVFLWVDLVVKSLLSGMANYDRISDLQKRLDEIPGDLEEFYHKILNSIEERYLVSAYRFFRLTEAASGRLTVLLLSFADEEPSEAHKSALSLPHIATLSHEDAVYRFQSVKRRINSTCKGFLELAPTRPTSETSVWTDLNGKVTYHHRTARDFLQGRDIQSQILTQTSQFDPLLALLTSAVISLKCAAAAGICDSTPSARFDEVLDLAEPIEFPNVLATQLLQEAQKVAVKTGIFQQHHSGSAFEVHCSGCGAMGKLLVRVADRLKLQPYILEQTLQSCCERPNLQSSQAAGHTLIAIALAGSAGFRDQSMRMGLHGPDLGIMRHLLSLINKQDLVNSGIWGRSPFSLIMAHARNARNATDMRVEELSLWADIAAACLEAGSGSVVGKRLVKNYTDRIHFAFHKHLPERSEQLVKALKRMERWPLTKVFPVWRKENDGKDEEHETGMVEWLKHVGRRARAYLQA